MLRNKLVHRPCAHVGTEGSMVAGDGDVSANKNSLNQINVHVPTNCAIHTDEVTLKSRSNQKPANYVMQPH